MDSNCWRCFTDLVGLRLSMTDDKKKALAKATIRHVSKLFIISASTASSRASMQPSFHTPSSYSTLLHTRTSNAHTMLKHDHLGMILNSIRGKSDTSHRRPALPWSHQRHKHTTMLVMPPNSAPSPMSRPRWESRRTENAPSNYQQEKHQRKCRKHFKSQLYHLWQPHNPNFSRAAQCPHDKYVDSSTHAPHHSWFYPLLINKHHSAVNHM